MINTLVLLYLVDKTISLSTNRPREPIENLYGHEDLSQTYEEWLKTENERFDSEETDKMTVRQLTI